MASQGNRHCANCIGTLSFSVGRTGEVCRSDEPIETPVGGKLVRSQAAFIKWRVQISPRKQQFRTSAKASAIAEMGVQRRCGLSSSYFDRLFNSVQACD